MHAFWSKQGGAAGPADSALPDAKIPTGLRLTATLLRVLFIGVLIVITLRISMPQNETIWTVYDTPLDVVRMVLGFGVCLWLGFQFFKGPNDVHGYRTWLYLGLVAVPFALICLIAVW